MSTYTQPEYATLTALQNTITNINNTINNEINDIQTGIHSIEVSNVSNGSKELHYNTTHTDYMFQKHVINNHRTLLFNSIFPHINDKIIKGFKFNYQI